MAKTVSFARIYEEYLNGFNFHCKEIERLKGSKISSLVSLLSISVIVDITTNQLLGDQPNIFNPIKNLQEMHDAVFMAYLLESKSVEKEELDAAIAEFKEAYKAVAHRINILFNVHLPTVQSFISEKPQEAQPQQEEPPQSNIIAIAK